MPTIEFDPAIVDFEPPVTEGSLMTGVCGGWRAVDAAGAPLPSGIYFLRIVAGDQVRSRKLSLVR
jgi:hypothetical protein